MPTTGSPTTEDIGQAGLFASSHVLISSSEEYYWQEAG